MIEQIGGRKFIGFNIILAMLFVLALVGKIDAIQFTAFITANFGIYVGGNVAAKTTQKAEPVK